MADWEAFARAENEIFQLDLNNHPLYSDPMLLEYKKRNSFGLFPDTKIHRIFQRDFLDEDIKHERLTLPMASSVVWKDPLENPLSTVTARDPIARANIDFGNLVRQFHALCWTRRSNARPHEWTAFAHGEPASRVTTSSGKLLDRLMTVADAYYMHRTWLIEVDYRDPEKIRAMITPEGVIDRLESNGARLAHSVATVNARFIDEFEVRLLYDSSIRPRQADVVVDNEKGLIRLPFRWDGVIENRVDREPDT